VPFGNATRDEAMPRCAGSHLWWMDDDDIALPDALDTIRHAVAKDPGTVHIFRMEYADGRPSLWMEPEVRRCNVGGTMVVVPNIPGRLGQWAHSQYWGDGRPAGSCGDYVFLTGTLERLGRDPVFHEQVIARIGVDP
jgi:hypothetical protein